MTIKLKKIKIPKKGQIPRTNPITRKDIMMTSIRPKGKLREEKTKGEGNLVSEEEWRTKEIVVCLFNI